MEENRLAYPDFCKFVAIFIATWSHCTQCISGEVWNNFLGGTKIDIAFNMPLFMIMSGWFISPTKMRSLSARKFVVDKFLRLIVPAVVWYFICCLLSFNRPRIGGLISFYWYLTALFVCLCVIYVSIKLIHNIYLCAILSSILVVCCPYSDFVKINFMFPFIWTGFFLRKHIDDDVIKWFVLICMLIGLYLLLRWTPDKTIYRCPFKILSLNSEMLITYIYRFIIGFSFSVVIIYIIRRADKTRIVKSIAQYGQFSLVIYTSSLAIISLISEFLEYLNYHTNQYVLLDCLSFILCIIIVIITIFFSKQCRKNKYSRLCFLGEWKAT